MKELSRLLAIETTDVTGSVALCERGEIIATRALDPELRSARSLAPAISDLLRDFSWKPSDVDVVAVAIGPGSFTGLRVGLATAKTFAWSVDAKIVGVDTLDAIANEVKSTALSFPITEDASLTALLSVGVDAQRGDVAMRDYWVVARSKESIPEIFAIDSSFRIVSNKKWLDISAPIARAVTEPELILGTSFFDGLANDDLKRALSCNRCAAYFVGPALGRVKNLEAVYSEVRILDESLWNPTAVGVARVAWRKVLSEKFDDPFAILPIYSRKAAAEERALEKQKAKAALQ